MGLKNINIRNRKRDRSILKVERYTEHQSLRGLFVFQNTNFPLAERAIQFGVRGVGFTFLILCVFAFALATPATGSVTIDGEMGIESNHVDKPPDINSDDKDKRDMTTQIKKNTITENKISNYSREDSIKAEGGEGQTVVYSFEDNAVLSGLGEQTSTSNESALYKGNQFNQTEQVNLTQQDDRTRIKEPWRGGLTHHSTVQLEAHYSGTKVGQCTGTIVHTHHVLTAAHCIDDEPSWPEDVYVNPALEVKNNPDNPIKPFGSAKAKIARTYEGFIDGKNVEHDFALLTLNKQIGYPDATMIMDWKSYPSGDSVYSDKNIYHQGYPIEPPGQVPIFSMWRDIGNGKGHHCTTPLTCNKQTIETDIQATKGQSGGPLYHIKNSINYELLGVVSQDALLGDTIGPRITEKKSNDLFDWVLSTKYVERPELKPIFVFEDYKKKHTRNLPAGENNLLKTDPSNNIIPGKTEVTFTHTIRNIAPGATDVIDIVVHEALGGDCNLNDPELMRKSVEAPGPYENSTISVSGTLPAMGQESMVCITIDSQTEEFTTGRWGTNKSNTERLTFANPPNFSVNIQSTNSPTAGDSLSVEARIENTGDKAATQQVELNVDGLGSDSTQVQLDGGESSTETFTVGTGSGNAGSYTAEVSSDDDHESTGVTVQEQPDPANFRVDIQSTNAPITAGETLSVDARIENTGEDSGTQTVELDAGGLGSDSSTVTLSGGDSTTRAFSVGTESGDAGSYTIEVSSDDDSSERGITVSKTDTNNPPTANDISVTISEGKTASESFVASDPDGDSLSYSVTTGPSNGDVTVTGESFTYSPDAGYSGEDSFTYQVSDGDLTDEATVTITVTEENPEPSPGMIDWSIDPAENNLEAGDTANLDVIIDGAEQGVWGATFTIKINNPSIASFADSNNQRYDFVTIGNSGSTLHVEDLFDLKNKNRYTMPVEIQTNQGGNGEAVVSFEEATASIPDTDGEFYENDVLNGATITVLQDSPPAIVDNRPRDLDGDGNYEDIRGTGSVSVFDVQTLFENMGTSAIQDYSEYYNFQGEDPDQVTVFDVQSLFKELSTAPDQPESVVFTDNFDSTNVDSTPSNWVANGNGEIKVTDTTSTDGTHSLRLSGSDGGCFETAAFGDIGQNSIPDGTPQSPGDTVNLSFDVRPMGESEPGCHGNRNTVVLLNPENSPTYGDKSNNHNLLKFYADGTVEGTAGENIELGSYNVGAWTDVTITYARESNGQLEVSYNINGEQRGTVSTQESSSAEELSYLQVNTGEYTTYLDDIRISSV